MMTNLNRQIIGVSLLVVLVSGCSSRNLYFHEQAKLGVSTEMRKDLNQPLSGHIGFKRTISAAVPVKEGAIKKESQCKRDGNENADECLNHGDAVSLVSNFRVKIDGLDESDILKGKIFDVQVDTNFASGNAATILTNSKEINMLSNETQAAIDTIEKQLADKNVAAADVEKTVNAQKDVLLSTDKTKKLFKDIVGAAKKEDSNFIEKIKNFITLYKGEASQQLQESIKLLLSSK